MTTPTPVVPSKAKAWWALAISLIGSLTPLLTQLAGVIPAPYGAVLTGVLAIFAAITGGAVHQAKYVPDGAVLAPKSSLPGAPGSVRGPWK